MPTPNGTTTTANFNDMLKKYLPYDLLMEEAVKRDYFLSKVNIKDGWKGGQMDVPFKAAKATSRRFGKLVNKDKIGKAKYGIGSVDNYKELWGAMIFDDHDLMRHDSVEQSFIKIIPDQIDDFVVGMKEEAGRNFLNNNAIAKVADAVGVGDGDTVKVTRPENFDLGQYVEVGIMNGIAQLPYAYTRVAHGDVSAINMDDSTITLINVQDGLNAATTLEAEAVDAPMIFAVEGGLDEAEVFTSLDSQILSAANGGSLNVFGVEKLLYPYTQSFNFNGAGIVNGEQLIAKIFESLLLTKRIGKGAPTEAIMSMKLLAGVMSSLQTGLVGNRTDGSSNGPQYFLKDTKASLYGWTEIEVIGVEGSLKLVGVNEMEDDSVKIIDWRGIDLHTNGLFERHKDLNGNEYHVERTDEGYKYITDIRMFGELVVTRPSYQGLIFGITNGFQV